MTPITFSRDSWHAWLVDKFTPNQYARNATNICQYMRWVGTGMFNFTAVSLLFSAFAAFVLISVVWDIQWMFGYVHYVGGENPPWREMLSGLFNIIVVLGIVVGGIAWTCEKIIKQAKRRGRNVDPSPPTPPGFVKTAYRSFKDKVCIRVEVK